MAVEVLSDEDGSASESSAVFLIANKDSKEVSVEVGRSQRPVSGHSSLDSLARKRNISSRAIDSGNEGCNMLLLVCC